MTDCFTKRSFTELLLKKNSRHFEYLLFIQSFLKEFYIFCAGDSSTVTLTLLTDFTTPDSP